MDNKKRVERLLKATEPQKFDFDFSGWVNRIGRIALANGLDCSRISWQGSPASVAFDVVQLAQSRGNLTALDSHLSALGE